MRAGDAGSNCQFTEDPADSEIRRSAMVDRDPRSIDGGERLLITATEPLWTVEDVASYLRLKEETVRMMARAGKIPAIKVGKVWRFKASEIKGMTRSAANTTEA
jgi:excisionase family DNA binding protein